MQSNALSTTTLAALISCETINVTLEFCHEGHKYKNYAMLNTSFISSGAGISSLASFLLSSAMGLLAGAIFVLSVVDLGGAPEE